MVLQVPQKNSGEPLGFVFHGILRADAETSVKAGRCSGESKVGKQGGCQRPARKEKVAHAWDTIEDPVVVMVRDILQG